MLDLQNKVNITWYRLGIILFLSRREYNKYKKKKRTVGEGGTT